MSPFGVPQTGGTPIGENGIEQQGAESGSGEGGGRIFLTAIAIPVNVDVATSVCAKESSWLLAVFPRLGLFFCYLASVWRSTCLAVKAFACFWQFLRLVRSAC